MKYKSDIISRFRREDFPVFTVADLKLALKDKGISMGYLYTFIHNLLRRKEIIRVTRGVYTFHDDAIVAGFAFRPFYYGFENALEIRGVSEQGTNPTVVTTRNVRTGVRRFSGRNYIVRRTDKRFFFGYDLVKYGGFWIPVSDVEKTVIDMLFFGDYIRDELRPGLTKTIDRNKLNEYLGRYEPKFGARVRAWLRTVRSGNAI